MKWNPLDGITSYVDDNFTKPRSFKIPSQHQHCAQMLEDTIAQVECFQTVTFPMKHGEIWEVHIYFSSEGAPIEWFGAACCASAATAMALRDYAE